MVALEVAPPKGFEGGGVLLMEEAPDIFPNELPDGVGPALAPNGFADGEPLLTKGLLC